MENRPTDPTDPADATTDTPTDADLVRNSRAGQAVAFESLTRRHFPMVFAIAYARLASREAAEDLAQEVFLRAYLHLAALTDPARFAAWLARIARNEATSWLRQSQSASRLVRLVPLDDLPTEPADPAARQARAELEADEETRALRQALFELPADQRELVMLHYFEGLNNAEIAERLDVHRATVGRQIEKALKTMKRSLEPILRRAAPAFRHSGGAAARTTLLVGAVAAMSGPAKAALLVEAGASVATLAAAAGAAVDVGPTLAAAWHAIVSGALLTSAQAKIAAVLAVLAILFGGAYYELTRPVPAAQKSEEVGQDAFHALYRLNDGEVLKRIAPPFIAERNENYRQAHPGAEELVGMPDQLYFTWSGKIAEQFASFGSQGQFSEILSGCGLAPYDFEATEALLLSLQIPGDWIVRDGMSREDLLKALAANIKKDLGRDIRFTKRQVEQEVVVARGEYAFHPIPGIVVEPTAVQIYAHTPDADERNVIRTGTMAEFLEWTGKWTLHRMVDETESPQMRIAWRGNRDAWYGVFDDQGERPALQNILDNLSRQTSLTFAIEKLPVDVWFVSEGDNDVAPIIAAIRANHSKIEKVSVSYSILVEGRDWDNVNKKYQPPFQYAEDYKEVFTPSRFFVSRYKSAFPRPDLDTRLLEYSFDGTVARALHHDVIPRPRGTITRDYWNYDRGGMSLWTNYGINLAGKTPIPGSDSQEPPLYDVLAVYTIHTRTAADRDGGVKLLGYCRQKDPEKGTPAFIISVDPQQQFMPYSFMFYSISSEAEFRKYEESAAAAIPGFQRESVDAFLAAFLDRIDKEGKPGNDGITLTWEQIQGVWLPVHGESTAYGHEKSSNGPVPVNRFIMDLDRASVNLAPDLAAVPFGDEIFPDGTRMIDVDKKLTWFKGDPSSVLALGAAPQQEESIKGIGIDKPTAPASSGDVVKNLDGTRVEGLPGAVTVEERVHKVRLNLRSLATAMEAYRVDNYTYPPTFYPHLTTPLAYIRPIALTDPFSKANPPESFHVNTETPDLHPVLYSVGPDGVDQKGLVPYDPAKGENSTGDVIERLSAYGIFEGPAPKAKVK